MTFSEFCKLSNGSDFIINDKDLEEIFNKEINPTYMFFDFLTKKDIDILYWGRGSTSDESNKRYSYWNILNQFRKICLNSNSTYEEIVMWLGKVDKIKNYLQK